LQLEPGGLEFLIFCFAFLSNRSDECAGADRAQRNDDMKGAGANPFGDPLLLGHIYETDYLSGGILPFHDLL
jgi:hypothetical protein